MSTRPPAILRDWQCWVAILGGPLFWLVLFAAGQPLAPLARIAEFWPQFLLVVLVYPVLEEIVFRGGVQGFLAGRLPGNPPRLGITPANLLTSLLFTGLHLIYHPPFWALGVFFPSLVFGYFRERHDRLATPIGLHVFYNAGFALLFMDF